MKLSPIAYYCDFAIYPVLIAVLATAGIKEAGNAGVGWWLAVWAGSIAIWTLLEYGLHRAVFHHAPIIRTLHKAHHDNETAMVGTPTWLSVAAHGLLILVPLWLAAGFAFASAASNGLMTGYLWYVCTHHALHHWHPSHTGYFYQLKRRHSMHHHLDDSSNFGVTTGFWDLLYGTAKTVQKTKTDRNQ